MVLVSANSVHDTKTEVPADELLDAQEIKVIEHVGMLQFISRLTLASTKKREIIKKILIIIIKNKNKKRVYYQR